MTWQRRTLANAHPFQRANRTQFTNVPLRSIADDEVAQVLSLPSLAEGDAYGKACRYLNARRIKLFL